ncbi:PQQ-binding-like beta-propeller repeat protein [Rhodococcus sovatensis]|uniref:PQQ-binding-like beta-propeller repeat protein n=1 Tax=Rhodococcus sovatensis TaxID=1805840 RepID=A0ABZ2PNN6_9NOCA
MTDSEPRGYGRAGTVRAGVAVAVAVVAVAAAVIVLVTHQRPTAEPSDAASAVSSPQQAATTTEVSSAPEHDPRWQIDSAEVYGRDFAAFVAPTTSLQFDSGTNAVIDAGDVLVAAVGLPNPRTYLLDDARLVGIAASDGAVLWSVSPDGGLNSCAGTPVRGEILCLDSYSNSPAFVAIGVRDGAVRRVPIPTGWFPYAIESDDTSIYVLEGNPEDSESNLHGGDVDALAAAWSLPITAFAPYEGLDETMIHIDGGYGVVTLGGEAAFFEPRTGAAIDGLELRSDTSVVDTEMGKEVWHLQEPFAGSTTVGETVYTSTGSSVIASAADTGDDKWVWPVPTDASGSTVSGSIVGTEFGVYFLSSAFVVQLE